MNLADFFESASIALPQAYGVEGFEAAMANLFDGYLTSINALNDGDEISDILKSNLKSLNDVCLELRTCVAEYLRGFPSRAYMSFKEAMGALSPWMKDIVYPVGQFLPESIFAVAGADPATEFRGDLYRMRTGTLASYSRSELFHIPFQLRHLVATQRYSMPGLPCLYLGSTLWNCWEELGRLDFHKLHAARVALSANLKVLDFGWRPAVVGYYVRYHKIATQADQVLGQAVYWPLLAACSIKRRNPESPFAPEYIVPQFLLQWIRETPGCDGLRYFSTRISTNVHNPDAAANYVLPVQTKSDSGYCAALQAKVAVSAPVAWPLLASADLGAGGRIFASWEIPLGDAVTVRYGDTDFFKLEGKLVALKGMKLITAP